MNARVGYLMLAVVGLAVAVSLGAAKGDDPLAGIKCPVTGEKVASVASVDYQGGKVYFCCQSCPKAFSKKTAKYAAKANLQLVQTGQAKQTGCPLSGKPVSGSITVKVASEDVDVCCGGCKRKVVNAEKDQQIEMIFGDAAFAKGFKVSTAE